MVGINNKKLNNEDMDNKLIGRQIKRLDNYINAITKIRWLCLVIDCGYIWKTTPNTISNGSGCPKCSNKIEFTNEIIDQRLTGRNIKRIGDYINSDTKIKWECEICDYAWETSPNNIRTTGCPQCAGTVKLTNEIVDQKLIGRNIKRLDNYINNKSKIRFQCLVETCHYIWYAAPVKILVANHGCHMCSLPGQNEKLMHNLLKINAINYIPHFNITKINAHAKKYIIDAFIPNLNIAIEYNGRQHYEVSGFSSDKNRNEQQYISQINRDNYIREFCNIQNIELIEIDGREYFSSKLEKYMNFNLIPSLKGRPQNDP